LSSTRSPRNSTAVSVRSAEAPSTRACAAAASDRSRPASAQGLTPLPF
jgi:hypothetical protein